MKFIRWIREHWFEVIDIAVAVLGLTISAFYFIETGDLDTCIWLVIFSGAAGLFVETCKHRVLGKLKNKTIME